MQPTWAPLSASALAVGALCLALGMVLDPLFRPADLAEAMEAVESHTYRWYAMAAMYLTAALGLMSGLPSLVPLFDSRARRLGRLALSVLALGAWGLTMHAALLVLLRILVVRNLLSPEEVDVLFQDAGAQALLYAWTATIYVGAFLLGAALLRSRRLSRWPAILLLVSVLAAPASRAVGGLTSHLQATALGIALAAVAIQTHEWATHRAVRPREQD